MKTPDRWNFLLIFVLFILSGSGFLFYLHYVDRAEARILFNQELDLFDRHIGAESRLLMQQSLRSLYPAAASASEWQRIIRRAHNLSDLYGEYHFYLEAAELAYHKYPKNRTIHVLYLDSLLKNSRYEEVYSLAGSQGVPSGYEMLVSEAFIHVSGLSRQSHSSQFPFRALIENPDPKGLYSAFEELKDSRFLLIRSLNLAVSGELEASVENIPFSVMRRYPAAYILLNFDAGYYDAALALIGAQRQEGHQLPVNIRHLESDIWYIQGYKERAYTGYREISGASNNWQATLNLLLKDSPSAAYSNMIYRLADDFDDIPEVCWFLADYWYTQRNFEKSIGYYQKLVDQRSDIINAHIRLAELQDGYITQGAIRETLWQLYYDLESSSDRRVREQAAIHLLWLALASRDLNTITFFIESLPLSEDQKLLLAIWNILEGDPLGAIMRLEKYHGIHQWYRYYLEGIAYIMAGNFIKADSVLGNALLFPEADAKAVLLMRASGRYYAGRYRSAIEDINILKTDYGITVPAGSLERRIRERL